MFSQMLGDLPVPPVELTKEKMKKVLDEILDWAEECLKTDEESGEYTGEWDFKEVLSRLNGKSFDNQHALVTREIRIQVCLFVCVFYIHLTIPFNHSLLRK